GDFAGRECWVMRHDFLTGYAEEKRRIEEEQQERERILARGKAALSEIANNLNSISIQERPREFEWRQNNDTLIFKIREREFAAAIYADNAVALRAHECGKVVAQLRDGHPADRKEFFTELGRLAARNSR
ncbi:MAG: hypothetical protein ACK4YU_03160, partial [Paracoccus sp. (in: a-proteobacteria)]